MRVGFSTRSRHIPIVMMQVRCRTVSRVVRGSLPRSLTCPAKYSLAIRGCSVLSVVGRVRRKGAMLIRTTSFCAAATTEKY